MNWYEMFKNGYIIDKDQDKLGYMLKLLAEAYERANKIEDALKTYVWAFRFVNDLSIFRDNYKT